LGLFAVGGQAFLARMSTPDVLVFFTDQQRWDTTGLHGNPLGLTPHFDRLARAGTHLATTLTCQPVCGPARSCLQTGQYATSTGVVHNGIPLRPDAVTLAKLFGAAGYETSYVGKWHLAGPGPHGPVPPERRGGYERWLAAEVLEMTSDSYRTVLYDEHGREVFLPGYRVDAMTDAVIRQLAEPRTRPRFTFVSYLEPHHQNHLDDYPPPDGYRVPHTGRWTPPDLAALGGSSAQHLGGYYGMVRRLDEALGRITDALKSLGRLENTVILFISDHGCHFKTRNNEYKRSWHESSARVPCFLHGGPFLGGGEISRPVSLVDLPPTLLEACGLGVPSSMEGHSLLPLVRRQPDLRPREVFIQISESMDGRAIRTGRWKFGVVAEKGADGGVPVYREAELYDLDHDAYELKNLIGFASHRELAAHLRERLAAWIQQVEGVRPVLLEAPGPYVNSQRVVTPAEVLA
jgi:arylsulfatase A-like enzyme